MIAVAWTTIALIAVLGVLGIYLLAFVLIGSIARKMLKDQFDSFLPRDHNKFRGRW